MILKSAFQIKTECMKNLLHLLIITTLFSCQQRQAKTSESENLNILFILADDMGWQDTSVPFGPSRAHWNDRFQTPALQRLADEGIKFTQAYANSVCSPSRVSLMTGQNEATHRVTQWTYLSGDSPSSDLQHPFLSPSNWNWNGLQPREGMNNAYSSATLSEIFREAGYRTMHFGKGHLGAADTPGADPKVFGFDVRMGGRDAGGCGTYRGTKNFGAVAHPNGPWRAWDMDHYFGQDIHLTEALTLEAKREIRNAVEAKEPFFCYFAHYAPHTPIEPDERFAPKYRSMGLDETEAAYASLIEGMDKSVGDLLNILDELGIAENTLVVFTSDNGGVSHAYRSMNPPHTHNEPLSSGKGSHHEGGIRVPALVRLPGKIDGGKAAHTPVIIYDWFPTLLGIAGLNHDQVDGLSLIPLLQDQKPAEFNRPLVWHFPNFWGPLNQEPVTGPGMGPSSTIRQGDWKLIYYMDDQSFELFNLANDLGEKHNLAAQEPERLEQLALVLSNYLRSRNAPMPVVKTTGKPVSWPVDAVKTSSR
jgi:arylsulfatase A-like enzyme